MEANSRVRMYTKVYTVHPIIRAITSQRKNIFPRKENPRGECARGRLTVNGHSLFQIYFIRKNDSLVATPIQEETILRADIIHKYEYVPKDTIEADRYGVLEASGNFH